MTLTWLGLAVVLLLGASLQRMCGMGMGLIAVPFFVAALGPLMGVFAVNIAGMVVVVWLSVVLRREVDWHKVKVAGSFGIVGVGLGWLLVVVLDNAHLELLIGICLVAALGISLGGGGRVPVLPGALAGTGLIGGVLNCAVGQAAPILVLYQRATDWPQRSFQASLQPIFLIFNVFTIAIKFWGAWPTIRQGHPLLLTGAVLVMTAIGLVVGGIAARYVSAETARKMALVVACVGAVVICVRGIVGVFG